MRAVKGFDDLAVPLHVRPPLSEMLRLPTGSIEQECHLCHQSVFVDRTMAKSAYSSRGTVICRSCFEGRL